MTSSDPLKNEVLGILRKHERELQKSSSYERPFVNLCYYIVNEIDTELSEDALFLEEAVDLARTSGNMKQLLITARELVRIHSFLGNQSKATSYLNSAIQTEVSLKGRRPPIGRCSKYRKSDYRCAKYIDLGIICPYLGRSSLCKISPKSKRKKPRKKQRSSILVIAAEVSLGLSINLVSAVYFQWTLNLGNVLLLNIPLVLFLIIIYILAIRKLES
jgi:hypothetical protein